MSRVRPADLAAVTARSDRELGLVVEEAELLRKERQPELVVELRAHGRIDARDDDALGDPDVEQDLGSERLDDLYHRVEAVVGRVAPGRDLQILGADAPRDPLALGRAQTAGAGRRGLY